MHEIFSEEEVLMMQKNNPSIESFNHNNYKVISTIQAIYKLCNNAKTTKTVLINNMDVFINVVGGKILFLQEQLDFTLRITFEGKEGDFIILQREYKDLKKELSVLPKEILDILDSRIKYSIWR